MATIEKYQKIDIQSRQQRYFSPEFRKQKVSEIERNLVTVAEVCREYQVSRAAVYKWIYKYSVMRKKKERLVLESESDTRKIADLKKKIKELEQLLGQKTVEIEYLNKMIELTEDDLKIDIKKKGNTKPSNGSGAEEKR